MSVGGVEVSYHTAPKFFIPLSQLDADGAIINRRQDVGDAVLRTKPWVSPARTGKDVFVLSIRRRDIEGSKATPRSAVDLVMERLRERDAATDTEIATLTNQQKEEISAVRKDYEAKVAEAEIFHRAKLVVTVDPDVLKELEANHRRDLGRFVSLRDKKIDAIRKGD